MVVGDGSIMTAFFWWWCVLGHPSKSGPVMVTFVLHPLASSPVGVDIIPPPLYLQSDVHSYWQNSQDSLNQRPRAV
jgi:hypothetical protein